MTKFKVTFKPDNKTIQVEKDKTLLSAAISAGIYLNSSCGGDGVCGKCKVLAKKKGEKKGTSCLACLTRVQSDLDVDIPNSSRLSFEKLSSSDVEMHSPVSGGVFELSALTQKFYLELPKPNLEDRISDLERLYRQIRDLRRSAAPLKTGLFIIKELGGLLRDSGWKVTVTVGSRDDMLEVIFVEPGDASVNNYGLAFDIGTTTVSGQLIDLNTGKVLGTRAAYNQQAVFGSDVITRIVYARTKDGLLKLQAAVTATINQIIRELSVQAKVDLNDISCILCAGNTTMVHLLLAIDPACIRREPYVPVANFIPQF